MGLFIPHSSGVYEQGVETKPFFHWSKFDCYKPCKPHFGYQVKWMTRKLSEILVHGIYFGFIKLLNTFWT